jgi:hypothetical protein
MTEREIARKTNVAWAICTKKDYCRVGKDIVPFDIVCDLSQATKYSPNVTANDKPVLAVTHKIPGMIGNAGSGVTSGVSQLAGYVLLNKGSSTVTINNQAAVGNGHDCLMNCDDAGKSNVPGKIYTSSISLAVAFVARDAKEAVEYYKLQATRAAGGLVGSAKSIVKAADGVVRILGNSVLQIGDILTLGLNHDSPLMQQVWIEQGALAAGVIRVVTNTGEVIAEVKDSLEGRAAAAEQLRAMGQEYDAAVANGELGADVAQAVFGGVAAARQAAKLGTKALSNVGTGPRPGSPSAQTGAVGDLNKAKPLDPVDPKRGVIIVKTKYKTKKMADGMAKWDKDNGVKHLSNDELAAKKLEIRDGKIYDSKGNLYDTSSAESLHSGKGSAIFVMDEQGNLYSETKHSYGEFHHSSFLSGEPVAAAGEIQVSRGVLIDIYGKSGHYQPPAAFLDQAVNQLRTSGVNTDFVSIRYFDPH